MALSQVTKQYKSLVQTQNRAQQAESQTGSIQQPARLHLPVLRR